MACCDLTMIWALTCCPLLPQASKNPVSKVQLLPDGHALVAGSSIAMFDVEGEERVHKWTGHPLPVSALCLVPGGAHFCSAAEGERGVAVWSFAAGKTGRPAAYVRAWGCQARSNVACLPACPRDFLLSLDFCQCREIEAQVGSGSA